MSRITTAQATVWRRWRSHNPDAPERFTPGRYRCPVHGGPRRDLSIRYLPDENRVLLHCFDGCPHPTILARLGLRFGDLSDYGGASGTLEGTYTYTDEDDRELLRVHRYTGPVDVRYEVWRDGEWTWDSPARGPHLLYRLPVVVETVEVGEHVYVVEGERHADALVAAGAVATTTAQRPGRPWKTDHLERLRDAYCTVVARRDEAGRRWARALVAALSTVAADVRLVEPATSRPSAGAAEHLAAGFGLDDFAPLDPGSTPSDISGIGAELPSRCSLETVEKLFDVLVEGGDKVALRATLACYAANMHLTGDAVWLGLVAGSSTGKTETASALARTPNVYIRATLSGEAALLSGTPAKDWAEGATGGLLRRIGDRGVLVLKDFTSILGMHREKRGVILAALREVYDGHWSREIGGEGGALLEWRGKLGLVMCSTTAYDRAHEVIAQMGDRFLLIRLDDDEPEAGMLAALDGAGQEAEAREALAAAVAGLLGHPPERPPLAATLEDKQRIARLANFVTLARSPVARDYRGEIELVMDREAPYRFGKQLYALWRACGLLGMTRDQAWQVAHRVARDSLPKLRWRVLAALAGGGEQSTNSIARAVNHPYRSTKRALEDLTAHGVVRRSTIELEGAASRDFWALTEQAGAVPEMSGPAPTDHDGEAGAAP